MLPIFENFLSLFDPLKRTSCFMVNHCWMKTLRNIPVRWFFLILFRRMFPTYLTDGSHKSDFSTTNQNKNLQISPLWRILMYIFPFYMDLVKYDESFHCSYVVKYWKAVHGSVWMEQCHLRHNLTLFHNKVLEEYILSPPGIKKVQLHLGCMSPKDFSVLPYNNCTTNVPYRRQRALKAIFTCTNRKFWCQHISVSIEFTALVLHWRCDPNFSI